MRHLFVPACLCLIAISSTMGTAPEANLDAFTGGSIAKRESTNKRLRLASLESLPDNAHQTDTLPASAEAVVIPIPGREPKPAESPAAAIAPSSAAPANGQSAEVVPLPKNKPEIKPVIWRTETEVCDALTRAANDNNLPPLFFIRLLFQESGFNPAVVSKAGAQGIAQFMPDTANRMGVENTFDPLQAIPASAALLRDLVQRFGNLGLAAAAYNAGPKRIVDWLARKGGLPQETQGYVKTITGRPAEGWKAAEAGTPAVKLPRHAPCQDAAGLLAWNGPEQIPMPPLSPAAAAANAMAARNETRSDRKIIPVKFIARKENSQPEATRQGIAKDDLTIAGKSNGKSKPTQVAVIAVSKKTAASVSTPARVDGKKRTAGTKVTIQFAAARKQDKPLRLTSR